MEMDPTAPLWDFIVQDGRLLWRTEEPVLGCPCQGTHVLGREWLYKREPKCSCSRQTDDFTMVLHEITCDTVPCPFCPTEDTDVSSSTDS